MEAFGQGWQYTVFDLGNGRVLKQRNSNSTLLRVLLRECFSFPFIHNPFWLLPRQYRDARKNALASIPKITENTLEPWMLGNPVVHPDGSYEQDKVVTMRELLRIASPAEGEQLIDQFVAFNKTLVERHLIDRYFDIGPNFGRDVHGRIVLIDLGELYSDPAAIKKQIDERVWHESIGKIPEHFRSYFVEAMDAAFASKE
jgi:hypothetical protein